MRVAKKSGGLFSCVPNECNANADANANANANANAKVYTIARLTGGAFSGTTIMSPEGVNKLVVGE